MEYDDILKGVMKMLNCCSVRANTIIVNRVNKGEKEQLEQEIQEYLNGGEKND